MPATSYSRSSRPVERPAGLAQQQVDKEVAGLGLVVVVRVGAAWFAALAAAISARSALISASSAARSSSLGRRAASAASRALTVSAKRRPISCNCANVVAGTCASRGSASMRNAASGLGSVSIGAGEPIGDVEEFAQRACGLRTRHRLAVRRGVAGVLDEARLDGERAADQRLESSVRREGGERRIVGVPEGAVVPVEPVDRGLQSQPSVERGGARIGLREILRARRVTEDVGKLGLQEGELRHRRVRGSIERRLYHSSPRNARCWSEANSASSWARWCAVLVEQVGHGQEALHENREFLFVWLDYRQLPKIFKIDSTLRNPLHVSREARAARVRTVAEQYRIR